MTATVTSLEDIFKQLRLSEDQVNTYFKVQDDSHIDGKIHFFTKRRLPVSLCDGLTSLGAVLEPTGEDGRDSYHITLARPQEFNVPAQGYAVLPLTKLRSSSFQARVTFDQMKLQELATTIKAVGVKEPLIVRPLKLPGGVYEIVAGERRYRASQMAKLKEVPCIVREMSDQDALETMMIENLQREGLTDYETARIIDEYLKQSHITQEQLAAKVGKTQVWVSHFVSMLRLEKESNITRVILNKLDEGHAREILAAAAEDRPKVIKKVESVIAQTGKPPSVEEIHEIAKSSKPAVEPEKAEPLPPADLVEPQRCAKCGDKVLFPVPILIDGESVILCPQHRAEAVLFQSHKTVPTTPEAEADKERVRILSGFDVSCPFCKERILINHVKNPEGTIAHEVEE